MTVRDIWQWIDSFAPFDTQEDFDNSGMLVGDPDTEVRGVYCALDVTTAVLDAARQAGANLIITHHPMLFGGRKNLLETPLDHEGRLLARMIREHTALIAAHTNLDQAPGGINDVLARTLGLREIAGEGYLRVGSLPEAMPGEAWLRTVSGALQTVVRPCGPVERPVRRVAVCSGAGSEYWQEAARRWEIDSFVTGEIRHHHALAMAEVGILGVEAGHYETEAPGIFALGEALQKYLHGVQCPVCVAHPLR